LREVDLRVLIFLVGGDASASELDGVLKGINRRLRAAEAQCLDFAVDDAEKVIDAA